MRASRPITLVVYVQHLMCLEGLAAVFDEDPTVTVVATTTDTSDLPDIVEQRQPGVCLFDVAVPDPTCIATITELTRRAPGMAIVALVDELPAPFVRAAVRAGVRGFARKDTSLRALRQTIDRVTIGHAVIGVENVRVLPAAPAHQRARQSEAPIVDQLTDREHEVLGRMMAGDDTRHIAAALNISRSTARTHVQNVRRKLGARTKLQAVAVALGTTPSWSQPVGASIDGCT
jgi:DNA-binding NarL/FixJ family response regulator